MASASLRGPAVPRGSDSTEKTMLTPYLSEYCGDLSARLKRGVGAYNYAKRRVGKGEGYVEKLNLCTHLLQAVLHDLGTIVDGKHNVGDANSSQSLNLVEDHGLVGELDQGLGQSKGL
jgi:hypothetical protein